MVRQIGPCPRIVGLLSLPGNDAAFDVDLPGAGPRAVRAVGRAYDLVVLPALAISVFPASVFAGDDAVTFGELVDDTIEENETVEKVAHHGCSSFCGC